MIWASHDTGVILYELEPAINPCTSLLKLDSKRSHVGNCFSALSPGRRYPLPPGCSIGYAGERIHMLGPASIYYTRCELLLGAYATFL